MAITAQNVRNLIANSSTTAATSYNTASIAPRNGALVIVSFNITYPNGNTPAPSISGAGSVAGDWTQIGTVLYDASGTQQAIFAYRARLTTWSSGALTLDMGASGTLNSIIWSVDEFTGVDTTGTNGAGAIAQSKTGSASAATSITVTLDAALSAHNRIWSIAGWDANELGTPETNWTQLGSDSEAGSSCGLLTQWRNADSDNSASTSWTTAGLAGMIVVELQIDDGPILVGSNSAASNQTSLAITVPTAGVPLGSLLIVSVAMAAVQTVTVSDSGSNTYTADREDSSSSNYCGVFSAPVTTALTSGQSITVSIGGVGSGSSIAIDAYYILAMDGANAAGGATGVSSTPSAGVTPTASGEMVYARLRHTGGAGDDTEDTDTTDGIWVQLLEIDPGAAASSNSVLNGEYKLVSGTTAQTYNPTLGAVRVWAESVVAYGVDGGGGGGSIVPILDGYRRRRAA